MIERIDPLAGAAKVHSAPSKQRAVAARRGRGRRLLLLTHRWVSLILGLVLVIVTTSGAVLVYEPELIRVTHPTLFTATVTDHPIGFAEAVDAVDRSDPSFGVGSVALAHGVYVVDSADGTAPSYYLDAGTGNVNGHADVYGGVLGLLMNLHTCALSCPQYAGYVAWLAEPSPIATFTPFLDMSWGAVLLSLLGAVLVVLSVTGAVIWWPRIRRWRTVYRVRFRRGRFARDHDLHQVVGVVAVLPLLIWGLTGMNFEVPALSRIWLAGTGGQPAPADDYTMEPSGSDGPPISLNDAMSAALRRFPDSEVSYVVPPTEQDGFYAIDLVQGGPDLWAHDLTYRGNRSVGVDAHDATDVRVFLGPPATISNALAEQWAQPALHYGVAVNPWWRALWFGFGMTPLLLMLTGLSTWLLRRRTMRRRTAPPDAKT